MRLQLLDGEFLICKLRGLDQVDLNAPFCFVGKTDEEISLVCPAASAPEGCVACQRDYRAMRVQGPLDFSLIGVLSDLTGALAQEGVGVFAISTFDTDYLLVKSGQLARAADALARAGHRLEEGPWKE